MQENNIQSRKRKDMLCLQHTKIVFLWKRLQDFWCCQPPYPSTNFNKAILNCLAFNKY